MGVWRRLCYLERGTQPKKFENHGFIGPTSAGEKDKCSSFTELFRHSAYLPQLLQFQRKPNPTLMEKNPAMLDFKEPSLILYGMVKRAGWQKVEDVMENKPLPRKTCDSWSGELGASAGERQPSLSEWGACCILNMSVSLS
ncbi:unnamed protein product [Natator depressus]